MTENDDEIVSDPINGVTDPEARRTAEITQWGTLAMQYADRAAYCERMQRVLSIDNPGVRETLLRVEFGRLDAFTEELINELGDFREVPLGIADGEGASDYISRATKRKELAAEKRHMSENEAIHRKWEAQAIAGTEAEKQEAYRELAKLDPDNHIDLTDIDP